MIRLIIFTLGSILVISEALTNLDDGSLQSKFKYALGINRITLIFKRRKSSLLIRISVSVLHVIDL